MLPVSGTNLPRAGEGAGFMGPKIFSQGACLNFCNFIFLAAELRESQTEIKSLSNNARLSAPREESFVVCGGESRGGGLTAKELYGSPPPHTHHGKRQTGGRGAYNAGGDPRAGVRAGNPRSVTV